MRTPVGTRRRACGQPAAWQAILRAEDAGIGPPQKVSRSPEPLARVAREFIKGYDAQISAGSISTLYRIRLHTALLSRGLDASTGRR